jgi:hypothetical protein
MLIVGTDASGSWLVPFTDFAEARDNRTVPTAARGCVDDFRESIFLSNLRHGRGRYVPQTRNAVGACIASMKAFRYDLFARGFDW